MKKNYQHMMEQVALSDRKKEEIMGMIENQQTQKQRMPKAGKIVLAAALAVGCVLSIAAGLPAQVYNFVSGGTLTALPGTGETSFSLNGGDIDGPITVEDGRLWFEANGQKIDITDKVDENTPYIYERTDPATGETGYVVAGGTVEDFGWAEIFPMEDGNCSITGMDFDTILVPLPDGSEVPFPELTDEQREQLLPEGASLGDGMDYGIPIHRYNAPWLDAAIDQLGLEID